jgi:hypothetical protein
LQDENICTDIFEKIQFLYSVAQGYKVTAARYEFGQPSRGLNINGKNEISVGSDKRRRIWNRPRLPYMGLKEESTKNKQQEKKSSKRGG